MSLPRRDIAPVDSERNVAEQDLDGTCGAAYPAAPAFDDGSQLVQWLPVQAENMAGDLQHNVRALMVRASFPMPVLDGRDEVPSLRTQLRHQQQTHRELQTMLKNLVLVIEIFQSKWQMAGQEAHAFIARTHAQSEDFVRAELAAVQRFEDSLQRQYMQQALRQQIGQEEYADAESTKEMNQLRHLIAEQAEAMQRFEFHSQLFVSQQQEEYAHKQYAQFQQFDGALRDKDEVIQGSKNWLTIKNGIYTS